MALHDFTFRDYQIPIQKAMEEDGFKRLMLILPRRCIAGDTHITLANGSTKFIQDIKRGDKILSFDGNKIVIDTVKDCWNTGQKEAIEIRSSKYPNITTSLDHKFYSNGKWVRAKDLKYFTPIFQQYNVPCGKTSKPLLAELIGYLTHDGYVSGYQQPKFTNERMDTLKRVEFLVKEL